MAEESGKKNSTVKKKVSQSKQKEDIETLFAFDYCAFDLPCANWIQCNIEPV